MDQSSILDDFFWNFLTELETLGERVGLEDFLTRPTVNEIPIAKAKEFLGMLKSLCFPVILETIDEHLWVSVDQDKKQRISFDFSFSEWLALQLHFPLMGEYQGKKCHEVLGEKLAAIENEWPQYDLFTYIEEQEKIKASRDGKKDVIQELESLMNSKQVGLLNYSNKSIEVYIHYLAYIDGELQLIGEEVNDRCLISLEVDQISYASSCMKTYRCNFSLVEVQDFISAIRSIGDKEVRLILKINSPERVDLNPPYHFLERPYIVSNQQSKLIWGATAELSEELFSWLYSIKDGIEILDPIELRNKFEKYCLEKNEKNEKKMNDQCGLKKAS